MRSRKGLAIVVLSLLCITIGTPMAQGIPKDGGNPSGTMQIKPTLTISTLEPSAQNATVSADTGATVTYTGEITVTKPPLITVMVTITSKCSAGYPTTVNPDTISFTQSGSVPITVTVVVPARAIMANDIIVQVDAVATMPGLMVTASATALLGISQYFDVEATTRTVKGSGNPQEFDITVQNIGNGNDTFNIEIVDKASLEKDGFRFELSRKSLYDVAPDGNQTIRLKVSYGLSTPSGKKDIRIRIISVNSTTSSEKVVSTETTVQVDVGVIGGGGSQTYLFAGLVVLIVVIAMVLSFMVRRRSRARNLRFMQAKPVKKVGDENGEDEPLKEPEELVNDKKDAIAAEHED